MRILGFPEEELIGCDWFESFLPEDCREEVREIFIDIITSGPEVFERVDGRIINSMDEERLIKWHNSVMHDEDGNITHLISSGEDITEKRILENSVKESEQKYRQLFEKANDALILRSEGGKILDVNKKACQMLGYSRKRLLTKSIMDLHTKEGNERFKINSKNLI